MHTMHMDIVTASFPYINLITQALLVITSAHVKRFSTNSFV